jgi:hypothetical protein
MTDYQKRQDICDHTAQTKQENIYRLEIYEILYAKGWKKLALDSLWMHPDYGILHILFALHLAMKPKNKKRSPFFWLKVILLSATILLGMLVVSTLLMGLYL